MLVAELNVNWFELIIYTISALVLGGTIAILASRHFWEDPRGGWYSSANLMEYQVTDRRGGALVLRAARMQHLKDGIWIVSYHDNTVDTEHNHLICFKGNFLGNEDWAAEVLELVCTTSREFLELIPADFHIEDDLLDHVSDSHRYERVLTVFVDGASLALGHKRRFADCDTPWLLKSSIGPEEGTTWSTVDLPYQTAKALKQMHGVQIAD